jgi:nitrite reductase (NO-forming)
MKLLNKRLNQTMTLMTLLMWTILGMSSIVGLALTSAHADLPVEKAILTTAPEVAPPIQRSSPAKVVVELEVIEKIGKMADGVDYMYWTYGGSVPGKFIRVREGDTVEFYLLNHPHNKLPHNIDLHAVTGPGGGAASTFTAPGHKSKFTFKALNPGLYIYHCATAPVGMHIANGMYGLIYVQPEKALPKVDHEYYVVQGDFYTNQAYGTKGQSTFSMKNAIDEKPTYVVFNGAAGSLVGDNALKAKVGETVRLFIGNGGPNLVSSFHVIGEIFDRVYQEGGVKVSQEQVQTTLVPAGGSAIVEFKLDTNGTYVLVDHSIFRAFNKGALGMLKVEGTQNKEVYSGKELDDVYLGDDSVARSLNKDSSSLQPETKTFERKESEVSGKELYAKNCAMCHQAEGEGLEGVFPPLAKSDYLKKISNQKDRTDFISLPILGKSGKMVVNGKEYNGVMTPVSGLNDRDLAAVLTYVANTWGNKAPPVSEAEVSKAKVTLKSKL